jgi:hypothetical protein
LVPVKPIVSGLPFVTVASTSSIRDQPEVIVRGADTLPAGVTRQDGHVWVRAGDDVA